MQLRNPWLLALVVYGVGALGLASPWSSFFKALTPLLLVGSVAVLLVSTSPKSLRLWFWAALVFVIGFGAEVWGVQSGMLFGEYSYGWVLGPKLWGVPLTIGLNWLMLTYLLAAETARLKLHWLLQSLLAAAGMVLLDVLIEPVAIHLGFWTWSTNLPPLQNFVGWFAVALIIQLMTHRLPRLLNSPWARPLLVANLLFFTLLNLMIVLS